MGLDTTHDAWHGAYSAFHRWREKLAEVAGLPPLLLMEGFYYEGSPLWYSISQQHPNTLHVRLPIRWDCLKPDILHELLWHSDCDGEIAAALCDPLAQRLEELLPLLTSDDGEFGHVSSYLAVTKRFIEGLRKAAALGEPVEFH